MKHPMQEIVCDGDVLRFRKNAVVRYLLDSSSEGRKCDLNDLAAIPFSQDDQEQFDQLIGYSVCGYHELSYVSDASAALASEAARKLDPEAGGCRDTGCGLHSGVPEE